MASSPNRKEAPAEPFKRVLGLCRACHRQRRRGAGELRAGKPEIDGKLVQLPEPSRVPSLRRWR